MSLLRERFRTVPKSLTEIKSPFHLIKSGERGIFHYIIMRLVFNFIETADCRLRRSGFKMLFRTKVDRMKAGDL